MNLKQLSAHSNDNIQNDRHAGSGLLFYGVTCISRCINHLDWSQIDKYTLAPRTVTINGIEVNAGMDKAPEHGSAVFVVNLICTDFVKQYTYSVQSGDLNQLLSLGMLFDSRASCHASAKAMLNFKVVE